MTIMNFIPAESQGSDFVKNKRNHRRKRENVIKREVRARRKARCSEKS